MQGGFDVFENQMAGQGMKMEIQRKLPDGSYVPASQSQVDALKTKARMTTFADALKGMTLEEKTACALDMKSAANQLYADQEYAEAMQCYMQALTASSFGDKLGAVNGTASDDVVASEPPKVEELDDDGCAEGGGTDKNEQQQDDEDEEHDAVLDKAAKDNINELVIPCLNNLCACCIALQEYGKGIQFAKHVLELQPGLPKTLLRMGRCHLEIGRYDEAIAILEPLLSNDQVDAADKGRAQIFLDRCRSGQMKEAANLKKRKEGMRRAFHNKKGEASAQQHQEKETHNSASSKLFAYIPIITLFVVFFLVFLAIASAGLAAATKKKI